MNTSAFITMSATWAIVTAFTAYFFIKVLRGNKTDQSSEDDINDG